MNNRNPYDGNVYNDGKRYFWDEIQNGKSIEVGGVNNWIGLKNRLEPMPSEVVEEQVVPISKEEQELLNNRNPFDGTVHMNGKKYFWNDISHGREIEVGGVNNYFGMSNRIAPLPESTEGTDVV